MEISNSSKTELSSFCEDKCVGTLLGVMVGDILGTPFEGTTRRGLQKKKTLDSSFSWSDFCYGQHMGLYHLPARFGMYTDDTNSTLALATSLVENNGLLPLHVAHMYGRFWLKEPRRGYPDSAQAVMAAVLEGKDIQKTGRMCFETGSFANGGIMRISPIGLAFRNASQAELYEAVKFAIISSHVNDEAVEGAFLQAYGITLLLKLESPDQMSPMEFIQKVRILAKHPEITKRLDHVIDFCSGQSKTLKTLDDVLLLVSSGFQIRSSEALACSFLAFLLNWNNPENCIIEAVGYGGDTDTIAAISGALCGALHGKSWIPKRWFDKMENNDRGRDYCIDVAKKISLLDLHQILVPSESEIRFILEESAKLEIKKIKM